MRSSTRLARCVAVVGALLFASTALATPTPVPWLPQRPAKATGNPPLARPCRADHLRAHLFLQGATGSLVGGVDLRNVGAHACALVGWPTVSFTGSAANVEQWQVKHLAPSSVPPDVLADPPGSLRDLQPGKSAFVGLFWSNWCGPGATPTGSPGAPPDAVELRLADDTSLTIPLEQAPRCDAPQYPSTISVDPYMPTERHLPPSSRLPLRVAILGLRPVAIKPGLRAFLVHRGDVLSYDVAITNTSAMRFRFVGSSCPVYIQQFDASRGQVYVLNCRPVAAIAPRQTVVFAMRIAIPAAARLGNNSLMWQLAPKTYLAPFAPAAVWVAP